MTRFYSPFRGAWTPRYWPSALASLVGSVGIMLALNAAAGALDVWPWIAAHAVNGWWTARGAQLALAAAVGVIVGHAVHVIQWARWERKHPLRPVEEIAREAALRN